MSERRAETYPSQLSGYIEADRLIAQRTGWYLLFCCLSPDYLGMGYEDWPGGRGRVIAPQEKRGAIFGLPTDFDINPQEGIIKRENLARDQLTLEAGLTTNFNFSIWLEQGETLVSYGWHMVRVGFEGREKVSLVVSTN